MVVIGPGGDMLRAAQSAPIHDIVLTERPFNSYAGFYRRHWSLK